MPAIVMLGPAHMWIFHWPLFFALVVVMLYGCFFLLRRYNIAALVVGRQYNKVAAIAGALLAAIILLCYYPLPQEEFFTPALSEYQTAMRNNNVTLTLWLMFSLVIAYSLITSLLIELYEARLQKEVVDNQKHQAELNVFKAQISPHFLFNTLNSLYSLVIGTSDKAEEAFIKFTDMLRYTYVSIDNDYVAIKEEAVYIQNYIDLQKLRLNEHTKIDWVCDVDDEDTQVPPMVLLTFVENCFKYGASTSKDCVISIHLSLKDHHLRFETRNALMKHAVESYKQIPVGIENCRARLESLYKNHYSLVTEERDGIFIVELNIKL